MFWIFKLETDPVCGMKVNKEKIQFSQTYKGSIYYFCSENCKEKFNQEPEKYHHE